MGITRRSIGMTLAALLIVGSVGVPGIATVLTASTAGASATDCLSYGYACTPGYTGANAAGTWAWSHYGGSWAINANGYHNCTLYAAWRLEMNGMGDPGNWGNAVDWISHTSHNSTPAIGSIAWWGSEVGGGFGHVAYVDQISGSQVHILADNYAGTNLNGYTDSGWIAASSADAYLHPHDVGGGGPPSGYEVAFQANNGNLYSFSSTSGATEYQLGMMPGTSPSIAALSSGGYEMAFQANTGDLFVVGAGGSYDTGQGMMAGTGPGIAASPAGGFEAAFQANNGNLYSFSSTSGATEYQLGMMPGTSPSIAALSSGGYEMAFQANTGDLFVVGAGCWRHDFLVR